MSFRRNIGDYTWLSRPRHRPWINWDMYYRPWLNTAILLDRPPSRALGTRCALLAQIIANYQRENTHSSPARAGERVFPDMAHSGGSAVKTLGLPEPPLLLTRNRPHVMPSKINSYRNFSTGMHACAIRVFPLRPCSNAHLAGSSAFKFWPRLMALTLSSWYLLLRLALHMV